MQKVLISEVIPFLFRPKVKSHKGENGRLLILGGSKQYHGAPLLAAKIASKIVDLVYFVSTTENIQLMQKMKSKLCEFIALNLNQIPDYLPKAEAVLIGPGWDMSPDNQKFLHNLLNQFPQQKFILDAGGLANLDLQDLNQNMLLTPHSGEFKRLFKILPTRQNVLKMAQKYKCVIVLKGETDYVADPEKLCCNQTGEIGLTKGGTGDVLAGLIASLACKNDLFTAASLGVYVNGLAGEKLAQRVAHYYSASDLIRVIPQILAKLIQSKKHANNFNTKRLTKK